MKKKPADETTRNVKSQINVKFYLCLIELVQKQVWEVKV